MTKTGKPRWNSNSFDAECLKTNILNGSITPDMAASDVQKMFTQFQKYDGNCFAGNLRSMRRNLEENRVANNNAMGIMTPETSSKYKYINWN